jgi:hypothetical protein
MQSIPYFSRKKFALMFNYTPKNQLDIFDFKTEFESKLDPNNRWVK